jgi:hypothetical protein
MLGEVGNQKVSRHQLRLVLLPLSLTKKLINGTKTSEVFENIFVEIKMVRKKVSLRREEINRRRKFVCVIITCRVMSGKSGKRKDNLWGNLCGN